jgi:hypothetical protein
MLVWDFNDTQIIEEILKASPQCWFLTISPMYNTLLAQLQATIKYHEQRLEDLIEQQGELHFRKKDE